MNTATLTTPVMSWGRLTHDAHQVARISDRSQALPAGPGPALPYGNGRSYGDVCLNGGGRLWLTRGLDRFMAFDAATGVLECEAGVLLDEIITLALPQGWFLPVTPGTRFVTLGGAIANDVHGKNHHGAGTFGDHVLSLCLRRSDGQQRVCTREVSGEWLRATIGGLGLTGVIVSARVQLLRVAGPWMDAESISFRTLQAFFALSLESETAWAYNVAWIDCVHGQARGQGDQARGIFFRANHAPQAAPTPARAASHALPFTPPVSLVNALSLRAFNTLYFQSQRLKAGHQVQHLLPFFYPLDALLGWNRMYGPRGFYQYQCVVPQAVQADATAELLAVIRQSGRGSFLAVLKTFGARASAGLLSFPMPGTTLALDFPNEGAATEKLFERLDAVVQQAGGRLYMAKDARMPRRLFRAGYPALDAFARFRDPGISSTLSRRLLDD